MSIGSIRKLNKQIEEQVKLIKMHKNVHISFKQQYTRDYHINSKSCS